MVLFKKSYAELSEAFVVLRLAEPQGFGRADIEAWLAEQRCALVPDERSWESFLDRAHFGAELLGRHESETSVLRRNAEEIPLSSVADLEDEYPSPLDDLAVVFGKAFRPEKVRIYRGTKCVIFDDGGQPAVLVSYKGNSECHATFLGSQHLVDALFWTWKKDRERAPLARIALCNALAKRIAQERIKAQSDFDKAVAVSEDGTKIVHATEVIVVDAAGCTYCHPNYFFASKILFFGDMIRFDCRKEREFGVHVERYIELCRDEPDRQAFIVSCDKNASTFITHKKFCPSPLPEPIPLSLP